MIHLCLLLVLVLVLALCGGSLMFAKLHADFLSERQTHAEALHKQKMLEIVTWAVYSAAHGLPKPPKKVSGFENYAESYERFALEIAALTQDAEALVHKWGLVWGNPNAGSVHDCAEEAMAFLDNVQETVENYSDLTEKYSLAAREIDDSFQEPTIGCTVRQCLRVAKRCVVGYLDRPSHAGQSLDSVAGQ